MEPEVHSIMIPYSIERVSKTQWQGKIFTVGETFVLEPTTKKRCANRLCKSLMPLLVAKIKSTWPDDLDKPLTDKDIEESVVVPVDKVAVSQKQLETLPPDTKLTIDESDPNPATYQGEIRPVPEPNEPNDSSVPGPCPPPPPPPHMYHPGENAD